MIDKLIRKPRENFGQIQDILRARVVLQNSEEVNYFVRSLRQQYKEIKIGKTGRFVSCKEKTSHDSNAARGDYEVRTIILSLDPFFNDKNSETSIQIPCEIQILHQKPTNKKKMDCSTTGFINEFCRKLCSKPPCRWRFQPICGSRSTKIG